MGSMTTIEIPVEDGTTLPAYLARPATAPAPAGVIVAHELFGVNPDIRAVAGASGAEGCAGAAAAFGAAAGGLATGVGLGAGVASAIFAGGVTGFAGGACVFATGAGLGAGRSAGRRRRAAGLRREEVALLANVSVTYYTYLEQGRPVRPSAQVLDALAAALRMSAAERRYLYVLAYGPDDASGSADGSRAGAEADP